MTPEKYRQLEGAYARFNEAIVRFHSDLIDILPPEVKYETLTSMQDLLQLTNEKYRDIQDSVFQYEKSLTKDIVKE